MSYSLDIEHFSKAQCLRPGSYSMSLLGNCRNFKPQWETLGHGGHTLEGDSETQPLVFAQLSQGE
jgi:hypothetical protein